MRTSTTSRAVAVFSVLGLLSLCFANCSKANFGLTDEGQLNAQGIYYYDTSFAPTTRSQVPVDLIWVIDNSGSMANEAAHVRANFQAFASKLEAATDFRLALISKEGTTAQSVSLPYVGARYKQVNQTVNSHNALTLAQAAIAPGGSLSGFLRSDSKKIFIVVTDDESEIAADVFRTNFAKYYPESQLALFGFVSKTKVTGCAVSRTGAVYNTLAAMTGGATYEVCNTDWTNTFNHLGDSVIAISHNTIKMPQTEKPIVAVLEVHVNGQRLSDSDFNYDGSVVSIQPSRLSGLDMAYVRIVYQIKMDPPPTTVKIAATL